MGISHVPSTVFIFMTRVKWWTWGIDGVLCFLHLGMCILRWQPYLCFKIPFLSSLFWVLEEGTYKHSLHHSSNVKINEFCPHLSISPWIQYSWLVLTLTMFLSKFWMNWNNLQVKFRWKFFFFFFWFFFSELGTEPRALCFLGKRSTTELNPQPLRWKFLNTLAVLESRISNRASKKWYW